MKKRILSAAVCLLLCLCFAVPGFAETRITASTVLYDDSEAIYTNVDLAMDALDGATIYRNKPFSFNDTVGPRTKAEGYVAALNGRGVKVMGGGVAQVATTLYLALKEIDGISYLEKRVYGSKFAWDYVDSNKDAILVDYRAGTDFRFINKTASSLRIAMRREAETLYCMVYPADAEEPDEPITPVEPVEPDEPETPVDPPENEPAEEENKLYAVYRCKEYINLRRSASVSSESIARIPLGATVLVTQTDGKLYKAKYDSLTGYVNKKFVKAVPTSQVREIVKCTTYVSLREEASSKSNRLAKLRLGTLVRWLDDDENGYTKVRFENLTGYALTRYIKMPK